MLGPDAVGRLAVAAAAPEQPSALLRATADVAQTELGASLVTVMLFDEREMAVQRLYSSNPAAYPPGGRKGKRDTEWGRHVLLEHRVFIGEGAAALRQAFDDHELILSLGLRSAINVPILFAGRCLGTLNVLLEREMVGDDEITHARLLAMIAVPSLQAALVRQ